MATKATSPKATTPTDHTSTASAASDAPGTATPILHSDYYVYLCDVSRRELFMMPTSHTVYRTCDRCDVAGQQCYQYERGELRLDHLSIADRDAFNANLDKLFSDYDTAAAAQAAADTATQKEADDRLATETAKMDADYAAAVAQRRAIDAAAAPQTPQPSGIPAAPPSITSLDAATFNVGVAGTFTVVVLGLFSGVVLSLSGALPSGVAFTDNGNGTATLAGTPAAGTSGTYPVTITASNGTAPNATQLFTLTIA